MTVIHYVPDVQISRRRIGYEVTVITQRVGTGGFGWSSWALTYRGAERLAQRMEAAGMTLVTGSDLPTREFIVPVPDRIRDAYFELHPSRPVRSHRRPRFSLRAWWRQYRASRSTVGTGDRTQPVEEFCEDLHRWTTPLPTVLNARTGETRVIEARLIPSVQPMWQLDPLGSFLPPPLLDSTPDFDAAVVDWLARGSVPELVGAT